MNEFIVYEIYCSKNNKRYIGSTKREFNKRKNEHLRSLRKVKHYNKYLQLDYNNYGEATFQFNIIQVCESEQEMLKRETYWMNYYGGINSFTIYNFQDNSTKNLEYSSNISKSNIGRVAWNKNRKMTKEELEVNRKSHLGIKRSKASIEKQKITIANNPTFGNKNKHLSDITKQKINVKNKGRIPYNKGKRATYHKYDKLVPILRNEYSQLHSYSKVQQLHPDIDYNSINRLIKFGYLSKL